MNALTPDAERALVPVRDRLLADARQEAQQLVHEARLAADERLAQARREAEGIIEQARADGEAQAAEAVERTVARARRQARRIVLAAQESLRAQLRGAVHSRAVGLRREPGYPDVQAQLTAAARGVLGPDATVREAPEGGVLAQVGSRRVDLSLPALADRALDALEGEATRLWTS